MRTVTLSREDDFEGWRDAARGLAAANVPAEQVNWRVGDEAAGLFDEGGAPPAAGGPNFSVPRRFIDLARSVVCHADPERFSLLYAMLLRLKGRPNVLDDAADPLVRRLAHMEKAVRREIHKMHAFVRFRAMATPEGTIHVAWFEPAHHVARAASGFFARRFANMKWAILTPDVSLFWDTETLKEGPGATAADAPKDDPVETVWNTYYAATFNPARLKIDAMLREMPKRFWKNMPETALVGELVRSAQAREAQMIASQPAAGGNTRIAWESLRDEAAGCTRCHLYKCATQTVFGEGPLDAPILFVGEQPGDQEDLAGRPFVGPAGQLFDRALSEAGIDRKTTYVTNAVKHFKFEQRGKRRIHQKPEAPEIAACRWWLDQERTLLKPRVTVAMGATAARSLFGKVVTISKMRGEIQTLPEGGDAFVTVHPSFLLRLPDEDRRREEYARFVEDLQRIHAFVREAA